MLVLRPFGEGEEDIRGEDDIQVSVRVWLLREDSHLFSVAKRAIFRVLWRMHHDGDQEIAGYIMDDRIRTPAIAMMNLDNPVLSFVEGVLNPDDLPRIRICPPSCYAEDERLFHLAPWIRFSA